MVTGGFVPAFTLPAPALGVDTIAQATIAPCSDVVWDFFEIGAAPKMLCATSFGHAKPDRTTRRASTEHIPGVHS